MTSSDSYEIGFAAETGWRGLHPEEVNPLPPFEYVKDLLHKRIEQILYACSSNNYTLYITEGKTFRFDIAKKKPYKGQRVENKPWHYKNLTVYMKDVLKAVVCTHIEADDAMAIDHVNSSDETILASRDKDTKQIPGMAYSWELGRQPSFGPELITKEGWLKLSPKRDKLIGTGLSFFYSQVLTGDPTDNIPGLPNIGPVAAFEILAGKTPKEQLQAVSEAYMDVYTPCEGYSELLEQGRLCWLTRRLNEDGSPQLWEIGLDE